MSVDTLQAPVQNLEETAIGSPLDGLAPDQAADLDEAFSPDVILTADQLRTWTYNAQTEVQNGVSSFAAARTAHDAVQTIQGPVIDSEARRDHLYAIYGREATPEEAAIDETSVTYSTAQKLGKIANNEFQNTYRKPGEVVPEEVEPLTREESAIALNAIAVQLHALPKHLEDSKARSVELQAADAYIRSKMPAEPNS